MLKRFKTKELVLLTLLGVSVFLLDFVISNAVALATGIPGSGTLVVSIIFTFIITLGVLIVSRFGAFSLMAIIYGLLAIPTAVFGPPGIYKMIPIIVVGLIGDSLLYIFNYKKLSYYLGISFSYVIALLLFALCFFMLGFPGKEELIASLYFLVPLYFIESLIGIWLARIYYFKSLKDKSIIKQIQG